jgi:hypothetical protein
MTGSRESVVTWTWVRGGVVLRPRGALALESDSLLRGVLDRARHWGATIIDLTDVTTITSASACRLVDNRSESRPGRRVILRGGSAHVQDVLFRASRERGL